MTRLIIEIDIESMSRHGDVNVAGILHVLADKIASSDYGIEGVNCMPLVNLDGLPVGGVHLAR